MDEVRRLIDRLKSGSLLRSFDDETLGELLRRATRRVLRKGEEIIRQGEEGDFAVCLLEGNLKVSLVSANGREIILGYAEPGEVLGEIALLDRKPRTATVSATGSAVVLVVPRQAVERAALANPQSMLEMMRSMAGRIRLLDMTVESDRAFSMAPRLARVIVRLMPLQGQSGHLRLDLSQGDLGAFAGMSRENVNRQLGEWEAEGLLTRHGRRIEVLDPDYFHDLAEFGDPD